MVLYSMASCEGEHNVMRTEHQAVELLHKANHEVNVDRANCSIISIETSRIKLTIIATDIKHLALNSSTNIIHRIII